MHLLSRVTCLATLTVPLLTSIPAGAHPTTIPEGTPIKIKVVSTVGSGDHSEGSYVPMAVAESVVAKTGEVLIEQDSPVVAVVEKSTREGLLGKPGSLTLSVKSTIAIDGAKVVLSGQIARRGKNTLGGPAGLLSRGRNVKLEKGKTFTVVIAETAAVDPGKDPRKGQTWEIVLKDKKVVAGEFLASEEAGYRIKAVEGETIVPLKKIKTYRVTAHPKTAATSPTADVAVSAEVKDAP
jgi:hypothetical protein